MNNIASISSISSTPAANARFATSEDGFQKMLNEVLRVVNQKEAQVHQARKEQPEPSLPDLEQTSLSRNQMNATISAQTHLSASMVSLYKDQESKNERSNRSRAVTPSAHI